MNYSRAAWIALGAVAGIAGAAAIRRLRRGRRLVLPAKQRDTMWDLPDDLTQAVANALPDEFGAFNTPQPFQPTDRASDARKSRRARGQRRRFWRTATSMTRGKWS
jgi:hypothetical protein